MIVLAIDTTARDGSAAVLRDGLLVAEVAGDPALTHGQRLPGELIRLVADAGLVIGAVDLLAVAAGPGSFTGLRVGISAMQGLAMAIGRPIVPVSTLDALARLGAHDESLVAPWVDAQRGDVFAAVYEPGSRAGVGEPTALPPAETLSMIAGIAAGRPVRFIGDGAVRYAAVVEAAFGAQASIDRAPRLLAACIARIAGAAPHRAVAPHAVTPIYIRRPDAELARERRLRGV